MSGHSKWSKLKHFKGAIDAKKSAMFTKVGRMITIAAREGGGDPTSNFKLRLAIEKAKQVNMPKDNVGRAIKRGTGELSDQQIENVVYEVYLPGGAALIIETLTDNTNRTVSNLRRVFNKYGGSLANQNAVLWMFGRRGLLRITNFTQIVNLDDFQLKIIDLGAEDIKKEDNELVIYTKPEDLQKVKEAIEKENIQIDYAEVEWFAKNSIKIGPADQKKVDVIFASLDDDPDVNDYYSNIE